jgi:hypothetical protein
MGISSEIYQNQNLMTLLGILKIALNHSRPYIGLNAMGRVNQLKEEEDSIFKFL